MTEKGKEWAVKLFNRSPLKQQKFEQICSLIGNTNGKIALDIGSDNGVVSLLLRERGGIWYSADLIPETVESIRSLVHERVDQISGVKTPYENSFFDLIVIVDFLEHIETDQEFLRELKRIVKPGGEVVFNVPNPKEGWLRKMRFKLGQTDEAHGHVRPGYNLESLQKLLDQEFRIVVHTDYVRFFSTFIDTVITLGLSILKKDTKSSKGSVVTGNDLTKLQKSFKLYSMLYPLLMFFVFLDKLFPITHGNMLIVKAVPHE